MSQILVPKGPKPNLNNILISNYFSVGSFSKVIAGFGTLEGRQKSHFSGKDFSVLFKSLYCSGGPVLGSVFQIIAKIKAPVTNESFVASIGGTIGGGKEISTQDRFHQPDLLDKTQVKKLVAVNQIIRINNGDTLWRIAEKIKPDGYTLEQIIFALYEFNPLAFEYGNINALSQDAVIKVPQDFNFIVPEPSEAKLLFSLHMKDSKRDFRDFVDKSDFRDFNSKNPLIELSRDGAIAKQTISSNQLASNPARRQANESKSIEVEIVKESDGKSESVLVSELLNRIDELESKIENIGSELHDLNRETATSRISKSNTENELSIEQSKVISHDDGSYRKNITESPDRSADTSRDEVFGQGLNLEVIPTDGVPEFDQMNPNDLASDIKSNKQLSPPELTSDIQSSLLSKPNQSGELTGRLFDQIRGIIDFLKAEIVNYDFVTYEQLTYFLSQLVWDGQTVGLLLGSSIFLAIGFLFLILRIVRRKNIDQDSHEELEPESIDNASVERDGIFLSEHSAGGDGDMNGSLSGVDPVEYEVERIIAPDVEVVESKSGPANPEIWEAIKRVDNHINDLDSEKKTDALYRGENENLVKAFSAESLNKDPTWGEDPNDEADVATHQIELAENYLALGIKHTALEILERAAVSPHKESADRAKALIEVHRD